MDPPKDRQKLSVAVTADVTHSEGSWQLEKVQNSNPIFTVQANKKT